MKIVNFVFAKYAACYNLVLSIRLVMMVWYNSNGE